MVFKYLGRLENLKKEVAEAQDAINGKYRDIFGQEQYNRLQEMSDRLIIPATFFDNPRQVKEYFFEDIPENASNKMLLATSCASLDDSGRLKDQKIRTSFAFYISDRGFQESGSKTFTDRPIASYVHEFDHFAWYALQKVPFYLARGLLLSKAKPDNQGYTPLEFVEQITKEGYSPDIKDRIVAHSFAYMLNDLFEASNRILDKQVLSSIGIKVALPWRGKEREYGYVPMPTGVIAYPTGGDPFKDLDDKEVVRRTLNWQDYFNNRAKTLFLENMLASLKGIKVTRVPLDTMINLARRK